MIQASRTPPEDDLLAVPPVLAETFTFSVDGKSYDHSGKYEEFCPFEYSNE